MAQKIIPYEWETSVVTNSLRFDTNTLPFPPPSVGRFISDMKTSCPINEYSDPTYRGLKQLLSKYENVSSDMITITNSGDEAIDILAKTFLNPGDYFVTTPPTYEMFAIQCEINRGKNREIPLSKKSFQINEKAIIRLANLPKTKLIFLVNPNNPTGSTIELSTIESIARQSDCIVVVDQAYGEFYGRTAVRLLKTYENLVILKSFSKFAGLAGARIGYLLANKSLSQKFDAIRFPMGVSYLSYKLAEAVLANDRDWIKEQITKIRDERKNLSDSLTSLGFLVYPSSANFLLVNMGPKAKKIYRTLKEKGIMLRDRSSKPYLANCVRITVRSKKENKQLIKTLRKII